MTGALAVFAVFCSENRAIGFAPPRKSWVGVPRRGAVTTATPLSVCCLPLYRECGSRLRSQVRYASRPAGRHSKAGLAKAGLALAGRIPIRVWTACRLRVLQLPQAIIEIARVDCPQKAFDHLRQREPLAGRDAAAPDRVGDRLYRAKDVGRAVDRWQRELDRAVAPRRDGAVETEPQCRRIAGEGEFDRLAAQRRCFAIEQ